MRKIANEELGRPTAEEFARMERMPVTVVLDNIRSAQNVGSFFRTADAFAAERICLCGITAVPPAREIHKTALGAELTVAWSRHERTADCLEALRREGCRILAVEQVEGSEGLDDFRPEAGLRQRGGGRLAGGGRCLRRCDRDSAGRHETFAQRLGGGGRRFMEILLRDRTETLTLPRQKPQTTKILCQ